MYVVETVINVTPLDHIGEIERKLWIIYEVLIRNEETNNYLLIQQHKQ